MSAPTGLQHIEINVSDLERSSEFWGWLLSELGYSVFQEWPKGKSWILGDTYIVLVQTEEKYLESGYNRKRTGLNHIALHVESPEKVESLKNAIRERGLKILYEEKHPYAGGEDHFATYFEDPDRIKIELVAPQMKKRSTTIFILHIS
jgi:catechol 2,3-dioxygenase-like lactoylglutathione lyase family enzyme